MTGTTSFPFLGGTACDQDSTIPRQALEWLPLPALVFEASLKTHYVNASARRWFGLDSSWDPHTTGAESFFGPNVRLAPEPSQATTEFGSELKCLSCHRIPLLAHSAAVPILMQCALSVFTPGQDYFARQSQLLGIRSPVSPQGSEPWHIVLLLGKAPTAPTQSPTLPLLGQTIHATPLPMLSNPNTGPVSDTALEAHSDVEDSFFPPLKPILRQRGSSLSRAASTNSSVAGSSTISQTPSSIFSTGSTSTTASSQAEPLNLLASPPPPYISQSPKAEESPAARIIAQHRVSDFERRRTAESSWTQTRPLPSSQTSIEQQPNTPTRPRLHRTRPPSSSSSSLRQHSCGRSSASSTTAQHLPSDSGSDTPLASDLLPPPLTKLARATLAVVPLTGIVLLDKECENGLVNDVAYDMLIGSKRRREDGYLRDGAEEGVAWSEDGYFARKRGTPPSRTSSTTATPSVVEGGRWNLDSPDSDIGLSKMTLSSILNIFSPPHRDVSKEAESSAMAKVINAKKPYRAFDPAFSTRIIDPLEPLLDMVARRGETPGPPLAEADELRVGIEVDVEYDGQQTDHADGFFTITEHPVPGFSSAQSRDLDHKRVRRRVLTVTAKPIRLADGTHVGGLLIIKDSTSSLTPSDSPEPPTATVDAGSVGQSLGKQQLQQILGHLPHLIWTTTPSGDLDYFNEQWYKYTGLEPETSLGLGFRNPFHKDDLPHTYAAWSRALATGEPFSVEYRCRRYDGVYRWMLGRANCLRDTSGEIVGWFGSCTDIDDAVATREALRRVQEDMDAVLKGADLALINFDRNLRLKSLRGATGASLLDRLPDSLQSKDAIGRSCRDLIDPVAWKHFDLERKTEAVLNGKEDIIVFEYDHNETKYKASVSPQMERRQNSKPTIVGLIIVLVDITGLKQVERALQDIRADHARSLISEAAAKEASQMKTEFFSTVNHELRTPISAIMGLSELLLDDPSIPPDSRDYVAKIVRSSEALLQMIGSILDISKAEAGKLEFNPTPFALKEILEETRISEVVAKQKGLSFSQEVTGDVSIDLTVNGDFGRIRQILNNFLSNAMKFTKKGGITMKINYEDMGDHIRALFAVADTGMGIKPETLSTLFQPYQQAPGTASSYGGTGLGLYISKKLAEMMNGEITFASTFGEGTEAVLTIPLAKSNPLPASTSSPATPDGDKKTRFDRSLTRVLIAEDNPVNREVAIRFLQRAGYSVVGVESGQDVLDLLEAETFQLLICDLNLPRMDGFETTRRLRSSSDPRIRGIKILALTASAGPQDRERCLQAGFNDYLTKPFKGKTLEKVVLDLLSSPATTPGVASANRATFVPSPRPLYKRSASNMSTRSV